MAVIESWVLGVAEAVRFRFFVSAPLLARSRRSAAFVGSFLLSMTESGSSSGGINVALAELLEALVHTERSDAESSLVVLFLGGMSPLLISCCIGVAVAVVRSPSRNAVWLESMVDGQMEYKGTVAFIEVQSPPSVARSCV